MDSYINSSKMSQYIRSVFPYDEIRLGILQHFVQSILLHQTSEYFWSIWVFFQFFSQKFIKKFI